jgi:hypothetical protein
MEVVSMFSAPTIGALVASWGFWALLLVGWMAGELDARRTALFIGLWVVGRVALEYFQYGLLFLPYLAVLDIALVFLIFKGDVRLR